MLEEIKEARERKYGPQEFKKGDAVYVCEARARGGIVDMCKVYSAEVTAAGEKVVRVKVDKTSSASSPAASSSIMYFSTATNWLADSRGNVISGQTAVFKHKHHAVEAATRLVLLSRIRHHLAYPGRENMGNLTVDGLEQIANIIGVPIPRGSQLSDGRFIINTFSDAYVYSTKIKKEE